MEEQEKRGGGAGAQIGQTDLAAINALAKTELKPENIYVFSVRLCDNEVDRDHERFDPEALERLGELFVGKSGLFDHQWSAEGQTARIFRTEVCREDTMTAAGDQLRYLKGWAYMLRSEKNADLIAEIEAGIKKEVSVGCSMGKSVCSICGKSDGSCGHRKGQRYGGKLCFRELREPADAYEWSFVAVPAQRKAGVLKKRFSQGEKVLSAGAWTELQKQAELGRNYLKALRNEVVRLALLSDDSLDGELFQGIAGKLEEPELLELKRVYERRAGERFWTEPQLKGGTDSGGDRGDGAFLI